MKSSLVAGSREADKVSMSCLSRKGRTGMRADVRTALEEGTKLDMWASRSAIKVAATGPQWSRCRDIRPSTPPRACKSSLEVVEGSRCLTNAITSGMVWLDRPDLCERKWDKVA